MRKNKILWISHDPIRESVTESKSSSGFWKEALLQLLITGTDYKIKVAYPKNKYEKTSSGNYTFRFPIKKRYRDLPKSTVEDLKSIIKDYSPDLIHIHGTEKPYGLISEYIDIPILISLQGFISESYNSILANIALPIWKKEKTLKEKILRNSFLELHKNWYYNSNYERKLVKINKNFAGRTKFDKNFVQKHNSNINYFKANELLRDEFYNTEWDINSIDRYSIYTSSFGNPLKGFHVLLEAVCYLKKEFPKVKIIVPGVLSNRLKNEYLGNSYFIIIKKMIDSYSLEGNIVFAGKLDGLRISQLLKETHVFALPSFIENSSNALGEAQIIGTPCVVSSNCGGIPSIIKENENGLFFRKGDAYDLANKIKSIFLDDNLGVKLSKRGRGFGSKFHNKSTIINQYSLIYKSILSDEGNTK